jgi:NTE family protein
VRALIFHLGVFRRLAENGDWAKVSVISSVSGGSLAVGLILAISRAAWPSATSFVQDVLPKARDFLVKVDIERRYKRECFLRPLSLLNGRAHIVGKILRESWGLDASLRDLPDYPEFRINCTTYETGKNWRFSKEKMGDYLLGYIKHPDFPVSDAIAASAAFPGLIGPLRVRLDRKERTSTDFDKGGEEERLRSLTHVTLWDGGVYENLGVESLYKQRKLQKNLDFLIVSDCSGQLGVEPVGWVNQILLHRRAFRLTNILADQTRALRTRDINHFFSEHKGAGCYIYIGSKVSDIFRCSSKVIPEEWRDVQADELVRRCVQFKTTLRAVTFDEFDLLFQRGYEVALAVEAAFAP